MYISTMHVCIVITSLPFPEFPPEAGIGSGEEK